MTNFIEAGPGTWKCMTCSRLYIRQSVPKECVACVGFRWAINPDKPWGDGIDAKPGDCIESRIFVRVNPDNVTEESIALAMDLRLSTVRSVLDSGLRKLHREFSKLGWTREEVGRFFHQDDPWEAI